MIPTIKAYAGKSQSLSVSASNPGFLLSVPLLFYGHTKAILFPSLDYLDSQAFSLRHLSALHQASDDSCQR